MRWVCLLLFRLRVCEYYLLSLSRFSFYISLSYWNSNNFSSLLTNSTTLGFMASWISIIDSVSLFFVFHVLVQPVEFFNISSWVRADFDFFVILRSSSFIIRYLGMLLKRCLCHFWILNHVIYLYIFIVLKLILYILYMLVCPLLTYMYLLSSYHPLWYIIVLARLLLSIIKICPGFLSCDMRKSLS